MLVAVFDVARLETLCEAVQYVEQIYGVQVDAERVPTFLVGVHMTLSSEPLAVEEASVSVMAMAEAQELSAEYVQVSLGSSPDEITPLFQRIACVSFDRYVQQARKRMGRRRNACLVIDYAYVVCRFYSNAINFNHFRFQIL